MAVLLAFLLLAAQYNSWTLPLSVMVVVPTRAAQRHRRSVVHGPGQQHLHADRLRRADWPGREERDPASSSSHGSSEAEGAPLQAAVLEACRLRLRPILMTSLAFIMGVVPLVFATGAGAEMRQAMGVAVFAGMLGVTLFGLLFTPVAYVIVQGWRGALGRSRPLGAATARAPLTVGAAEASLQATRSMTEVGHA